MHPSPQRGRSDGSTPAAQPQPEGREAGLRRPAGRALTARPRPPACRPRTSHGCTSGAPAMWRTRRTMDCAPAGATAARTQAAGLALRLAMPGRPAPGRPRSHHIAAERASAAPWGHEAGGDRHGRGEASAPRPGPPGRPFGAGRRSWDR